MALFTAVPNSAVLHEQEVVITIGGTPLPLERPKAGAGRASLAAKKLGATPRYHMYSRSKKKQAEFISAMTYAIGNQTIPQRLWEADVAFEATFCFPRPQSHFDKDGSVKPAHRSEKINVQKADVDNLVKFSLDCVQGLIIKNDWQVYRIHAEKRWSNGAVKGDNGKYVGTGYTSLRVDGSNVEADLENHLVPTQIVYEANYPWEKEDEYVEEDEDTESGKCSSEPKKRKT